MGYGGLPDCARCEINHQDAAHRIRDAHRLGDVTTEINRPQNSVPPTTTVTSSRLTPKDWRHAIRSCCAASRNEQVWDPQLRVIRSADLRIDTKQTPVSTATTERIRLDAAWNSACWSCCVQPLRCEPFSRGESQKEVLGAIPGASCDHRVVDVTSSGCVSKLEDDPANP